SVLEAEELARVLAVPAVPGCADSGHAGREATLSVAELRRRGDAEPAAAAGAPGGSGEGLATVQYLDGDACRERDAGWVENAQAEVEPVLPFAERNCAARRRQPAYAVRAARRDAVPVVTVDGDPLDVNAVAAELQQREGRDGHGSVARRPDDPRGDLR